MTQEKRLEMLNKAKNHLRAAEVDIHDAGILHDDAMLISTNRFSKIRQDVGEFVRLIEECERSIRTEKVMEASVEESQS